LDIPVLICDTIYRIEEGIWIVPICTRHQRGMIIEEDKDQVELTFGTK
jgi:hypothetical protein